MSTADARVELSKCAGSQFDPTVVRAFLNVGLQRVRLAMGPFASLPILVNTLVSGVAAGAGKVALATTALATGVAASAPIEPPVGPALLAFAEDAADWVDAEIAALRTTSAEPTETRPASTTTPAPTPAPSPVAPIPTPEPQPAGEAPQAVQPVVPTPDASPVEPTPTPLPPVFDLFDDQPSESTTDPAPPDSTTDPAPPDAPASTVDGSQNGGNHGLGNQGNGQGNQGQGHGPGGRGG
jgi:outer membrane biosynthesis protein TonB